MLSKETLAYGERMAPALLGLDQIYRAESGDEEGLIVLNMGRELLATEEFEGYAQARERFQEFRKLAAELPEPDRRRYYDQYCHSLLSFIQWRDGGLPFESQLKDFLHVPAEPASDDELDILRSQMRSLLNSMGYSGDLAAQCTAWEARNRVPANEVPEVIGALMDEAWDRTNERLPIPADKSDMMQVEPVSGMAFNARCNYEIRKIELNIDPILTRPGLKHLAVHEGCPGHYVQFKIREVGYQQGTGTADGLLSVVNTAGSSPFEGIADNGLHMVDWIESDDDRFLVLMNQYRAGIGTGAAWRMHALNWPDAKVTDWLRSVSLVGGEGWVANRIRFLSAPERAVLIWSYWWGERVVTPVWRRVPVERRSEFYDYLYGRGHSLQTVEMFQ